MEIQEWELSKQSADALVEYIRTHGTQSDKYTDCHVLKLDGINIYEHQVTRTYHTVTDEITNIIPTITIERY